MNTNTRVLVWNTHYIHETIHSTLDCHKQLQLYKLQFNPNVITGKLWKVWYKYGSIWKRAFKVIKWVIFQGVFFQGPKMIPDNLTFPSVLSVCFRFLSGSEHVQIKLRVLEVVNLRRRHFVRSHVSLCASYSNGSLKAWGRGLEVWGTFCCCWSEIKVRRQWTWV